MPLSPQQLEVVAAYSRAELARLDAEAEARRQATEGTLRVSGSHRTEAGPGLDPEPNDNPPAEWEPPASLEERTAPPLPVDVLPATIRHMVCAVSDYAQTPTDLAYLVALGCLGATTMKRIRIEGSPGWTEPTNLYVAAVLEPGQRKSEVMRKVVAPVYDWERRKALALTVEVARAQETRAADERHLVRLRDDVAKGKPVQQEADSLSEKLASTPRPVLPKLIVDDVTPEKLANMLADHGERLAVVSAEGGIFGVNLGRRYGADGAAHFEVYLKAHGGDPMRVDRVKGACSLLSEPLLAVIVTIQPRVLGAATGDDDVVGRGLLARFLVAVPETTMGRRLSNGPPIPAEVSEAWTSLLTRLLDYPAPTDTVLTLSAAAASEFRRFRDRLEPRLSPAVGDLAGISGWAGKLHGAALRIAGGLHAVECIEGRNTWACPVSCESMRAAIAIGEALVPHAVAAMDRAGGDPRADDARTVLRWLRREGALRITERDAYRCWAGRRTVEQVQAAIELLRETGYIRPADREDVNRRGRRPSPAYDVHPLLSGDSGNCGNGHRYTGGVYHFPSLEPSPPSYAEPLPELPETHPEADPDDCPRCGSDTCPGDCPAAEEVVP